MLLADMGAEVTKVERPGVGDDTRGWIPPAWNGQSATFLSANRNKRSLAIDLDTGAGRDVVMDLARDADVLVESFRPGSLDQRGLGYESLRRLNPGLIYASISAYGGSGPKRDLPGYDAVLQAESGIMEMTGHPEAAPARLSIGAIDLGTALWTTIGIQAALTNRRASGEGSLVEASLFETASWWMSYHLAGFMGSGVVPGRNGTSTPFIAPYEAFATGDEDFFVAAPNDNMFASLVGQMGMESLATDGRFATNTDRVANRVALRAALQPRFLERRAEEWEATLRECGIPCSRVRSVAELSTDTHLEALRMFVDFDHPDVPNLRLVDTPLSLDGERATHRLAPPLLGQHTDDVLLEHGLDQPTIDAMRTAGVIG